MAATAAAREKFAKACVDAFIDGNFPGLAPGAAKGVFDGIDVDWEYPVAGGDEWSSTPIIHRPEDRANATLLFAELREQLDAAGARDGRHYELTAALPAGDTTPTRSFEIDKIFRILDWAGVMTYDYHGSWEQQTGFNSPLRFDPADPTRNRAANTVGSIDFYLAHGAPADKLVVGVPFYGKQWANVGPTNHGLYQPGNTQGLVAEDLTVAGTHPTYHSLVDVDRVVTDTEGHGNNQKGLAGFTRYWNEASQNSFLYNPTTQRWITYEDPHSVFKRAQYIRSHKLRGVMIWEISQDSDDHDLVEALGKLLPKS